MNVVRISMILGPALAILAGEGRAAQGVSSERAIADAVLPLPESAREGATVLGHAKSGGPLEVLREGDNAFICLADEPGDDRFQVSCYHRGLEPFMARGRALRAEGKGVPEVRQIRQAEMASGELTIPEGAHLVSLFGSIDEATGVPDSLTPLHVIYLPYATADETGLSPVPAGDGPWLMDAGLHRAHVMISGPSRPYRQ